MLISILALTLLGLTIASYFTLAYFGRVRKARWVPEALCARQNSSCVTILQTRYAYILGIPNALVGVAYYLLLIAWVLLRLTGWIPAEWMGSVDVHIKGWHLCPSDSVAGGLALLSAVAVILGFFLVYALRRSLHIHCLLCYLAHVINGTLLVLLIGVAW